MLTYQHKQSLLSPLKKQTKERLEELASHYQQIATSWYKVSKYSVEVFKKTTQNTFVQLSLLGSKLLLSAALSQCIAMHFNLSSDCVLDLHLSY